MTRDHRSSIEQAITAMTVDLLTIFPLQPADLVRHASTRRTRAIASLNARLHVGEDESNFIATANLVKGICPRPELAIDRESLRCIWNITTIAPGLDRIRFLKSMASNH